MADRSPQASGSEDRESSLTTRLPIELFQMIVAELPTKSDVNALSKTSRAKRTLVNPLLYKEVTLFVDRRFRDAFVYHLTPANLRHTRALVVYSYTTNCLGTTLPRLDHRLPRSIEEAVNEWVVGVLQHIPRGMLRTFQWLHPVRLRWGTCKMVLQAHGANEVMILKSVGALFLGTAPSSLTSLDLQNDTFLTDALLSIVADRLQHLALGQDHNQLVLPRTNAPVEPAEVETIHFPRLLTLNFTQPFPTALHPDRRELHIRAFPRLIGLHLSWYPHTASLLSQLDNDQRCLTMLHLSVRLYDNALHTALDSFMQNSVGLKDFRLVTFVSALGLDEAAMKSMIEAHRASLETLVLVHRSPHPPGDAAVFNVAATCPRLKHLGLNVNFGKEPRLTPDEDSDSEEQDSEEQDSEETGVGQASSVALPKLLTLHIRNMPNLVSDSRIKAAWTVGWEGSYILRVLTEGVPNIAPMIVGSLNRLLIGPVKHSDFYTVRPTVTPPATRFWACSWPRNPVSGTPGYFACPMGVQMELEYERAYGRQAIYFPLTDSLF